MLRRLFVLVLIVFAAGNIHASPVEKSWQEKQKNQLADHYERHTIPIVFYGMVEDLDGNPVANAEVTMRLTWLPPTPMLKDQKLIKRTTDEYGRFMIETTGYQLYLVDIAKNGYQYHFKYNKERGFRFIKGEKLVEQGQFEDKPVVFNIRKKGVPTLVLTGQMGFQFLSGKNSLKILDLLKLEWSEPDYIRYKKMMFNDWHGDIQMSVEGEANEYRLIVKALDENTGIAYGERESYEAPENGYQQEVVVPIKTLRNDIKADFFVKGRNGQFFSVLRIDLHALESSVYVDIGYGTNPNGSRNLEPSAELQEEYLNKKYGRE